jgi:hypothetical protein
MMDVQIFKLKLSVHATSLYILITELALSGVRPSSEELYSRFNATEEETRKALKELLLHNVLYENHYSLDRISYHPNPASLWKLPGN